MSPRRETARWFAVVLSPGVVGVALAVLTRESGWAFLGGGGAFLLLELYHPDPSSYSPPGPPVLLALGLSLVLTGVGQLASVHVLEELGAVVIFAWLPLAAWDAYRRHRRRI
jgi:hypothetical protein